MPTCIEKKTRKTGVACCENYDPRNKTSTASANVSNKDSYGSKETFISNLLRRRAPWERDLTAKFHPNELNTILKITQLIPCLPVCTDQIVNTHTHTHNLASQVNEYWWTEQREAVYCLTCKVFVWAHHLSHAGFISGNSRFDPRPGSRSKHPEQLWGTPKPPIRC